jgi:hypothetical protein
MTVNVVCQLRVPEEKRLASFITENAKYKLPVCTQGSHEGQSLTILGAGPSLKDYTGSLTHQVWACNSALPYIAERGIRVTHGFTIDSGIEMLDEWGKTYDVEYLVASSANPSLTAHLLLEKRKVRIFHNYIGFNPPGTKDTESELYSTLYPTSLRAGHGLNSVPRAVCLAMGMGFRKVMVYGADCGVSDCEAMPEMASPEYGEWMDRLVVYADGRTAGQMFGHESPMAECTDFEGENGRRWITRPDMIISAMHLLELQEAFPGRIELMGDTLPAVLARQSKEWMEGMPTLNRQGEMTGFATPSWAVA